MKSRVIIYCGAAIACVIGCRVVGAMERENELELTSVPVVGLSPRDVLCARGLFVYSQIGDEYDLAKDVEDLAVLGEREHDESSVHITASFFSAILGIPARQDTIEIDEIREIAFVRPDDPATPRRQWTQYLAAYPGVMTPEEGAGTMAESMQPERVTIWRQGVLYSWRPWMRSRWDESSAPRGNNLIPQFHLFGSNKDYIKPEHFDEELWEMSSVTLTNEGIIRYTWISKQQPIRSERGVEISTEHPHEIRRAWSGYVNNPPTRESIYEDFVQVSGDVLYPRISRFRTIIPLGEDTIVVSEETYRLISTNIILSCDFDKSIFEAREEDRER